MTMRATFLSMLMLLSLPAMAAEAPKGTLVSLSAKAEQMLPNNEVVVSFRIEAEGPKAALLRARVNRISHAVAARLAREKDVRLATTGRRIEPRWHYDNASHRQIRDGWRLVQTGRATSNDLDAVPAWVDAIEGAGADLNNLNFRVSSPAMAAARQRLRLQAIARFRRRAAETARALDAVSFRILHLRTDTIVPVPVRPPMMAMAKALDAAPAPALEAGQGRVTVTVSGEILLPERDYPVK